MRRLLSEFKTFVRAHHWREAPAVADGICVSAVLMEVLRDVVTYGTVAAIIVALFLVLE